MFENCCFLQDLIANPKCSLLVAKDPEDRTDLVITLHGDSIPVSVFSLFFLMIISKMFLLINYFTLADIVPSLNHNCSAPI
jgi:hypothetical protein